MSVANADTLLWQSRTRIVVVVSLTLAWMGLRYRGLESSRGSIAQTMLEPGTILWLALATVVGYLTITSAIYLYARQKQSAGSAVVFSALAMDIMLLFIATALTTPAQHFDRPLIVSWFILQFALLYRGIRTAVVTAAAISVMYVGLLLLATYAGFTLAWGQELWTLLLFIAAVLGILALQGGVTRRLERLAYLFGRMAAGDFSERYDDGTDRQPDNVTAVGRAYNRMRVDLAQIVHTDALSGCLNRRGFEEAFTRELARASRETDHIALIALDLDFFKQVNDSFGHLAGDAVIRQLGALLRAEARTGDVVTRLGGEEFAILVPHMGEEEAVQIANRVLEAIRSRTFAGISAGHQLTASAGVVSALVTSEDMAEDLRARADEALYAAKRGGRNRVVSWSQGMRARSGEWMAVGDGS